MKKYLVIDIGGTFTKYAVMDESCRFYSKDKIETVKSDLEGFIEMLVRIYESTGEVSGIAISSAGMIDSETGFMYNGGSLFMIKNINLVEILEHRCHVPVTVENDARCAGLAEVWKGALSDCRNSIALIIGTAIGGAVVVDRKVLKGKNCMAGEFSYILTNAKKADDKDQIFAVTGGMPALFHLASARLGIPEAEITGEMIFSRANCGEQEALACIRQYARALAVQINNLQFIFDPEKIAIGGGVSEQPLLLQLIREELRSLSEVYPYPVPVAEITNCRFFNDSNLIGALYVHLKAQEEEIRPERVRELLDLVKNRREGEYLRALLRG